MELWDGVRWLHLVAMAFFVGGQLMLAAVVVPVARRANEREQLRAMARRFGYGTLVAIAVLIASGAALASHYSQWSNGTLHVKLGLVALTAVLVVWHMRRPQHHAIEGLVFVASLVIVWLGIALAH